MDGVRGIVVVSSPTCVTSCMSISQLTHTPPLSIPGYLARNAHTLAVSLSQHSRFLALDNASTQSFAMSQLTYSLRPSHALDLWSAQAYPYPHRLPYPILTCPARYFTPRYSALRYDPHTRLRISNLIMASDLTQNAPYPSVNYLYHHCFLRVLAYRRRVVGSLVVSGFLLGVGEGARAYRCRHHTIVLGMHQAG